MVKVAGLMRPRGAPSGTVWDVKGSPIWVPWGGGSEKTLSRMNQDGGEAQGGGHMGIDGGAKTADGRKKE